eukprot:1160448-Pelagomonas_calceolata.AAC.5
MPARLAYTSKEKGKAAQATHTSSIVLRKGWPPPIHFRELLDQVNKSENFSRAIPACVFPNGTGSSAPHQSRPDVIFVRSFPGRRAHLHPSKIPPQDRDIHLTSLQKLQQLNMLTR